MAEQIFPSVRGGSKLEQGESMRRKEQQHHVLTVGPHPLLPLCAHGFVKRLGVNCGDTRWRRGVWSETEPGKEGQKAVFPECFVSFVFSFCFLTSESRAASLHESMKRKNYLCVLQAPLLHPVQWHMASHSCITVGTIMGWFLVPQFAQENEEFKNKKTPKNQRQMRINCSEVFPGDHVCLLLSRKSTLNSNCSPFRVWWCECFNTCGVCCSACSVGSAHCQCPGPSVQKCCPGNMRWLEWSGKCDTFWFSPDRDGWMFSARQWWVWAALWEHTRQLQMHLWTWLWIDSW